MVAIGWLHSGTSTLFLTSSRQAILSVKLVRVRTARYETEKLSLAVQDTLICFEMPLFAFLHLYAFSCKYRVLRLIHLQ